MGSRRGPNQPYDKERGIFHRSSEQVLATMPANCKNGKKACTKALEATPPHSSGSNERDRIPPRSSMKRKFVNMSYINLHVAAAEATEEVLVFQIIAVLKHRLLDLQCVPCTYVAVLCFVSCSHWLWKPDGAELLSHMLCA